MRGRDAQSCLSVLGVDRHRKGQTCVSMAMSGCSPFPSCWDRGMNEISSKHTFWNGEQGARSSLLTAWHLTPWELELAFRESYQFLEQTVRLYMSPSVYICVWVCVYTLSSPLRCSYLLKHIHFLLMEDKHRKEGKQNNESRGRSEAPLSYVDDREMRACFQIKLTGSLSMSELLIQDNMAAGGALSTLV